MNERSEIEQDLLDACESMLWAINESDNENDQWHAEDQMERAVAKAKGETIPPRRKPKPLDWRNMRVTKQDLSDLVQLQ